MVKLGESMNLDMSASMAKINGMNPEILIAGGIVAGLLMLVISYLISFRIMMKKEF